MMLDMQCEGEIRSGWWNDSTTIPLLPHSNPAQHTTLWIIRFRHQKHKTRTLRRWRFN